MVAIKGKKALPSGPVISTIKSSRPPMINSRIFCPFRGISFNPLENKKAVISIMIMINQEWVTCSYSWAKVSKPRPAIISFIK
jgi:hypothetical protein